MPKEYRTVQEVAGPLMLVKEVEGGVIFLAITFSIMMLLVDLAYAYIDPRIKAQYEGGKGGH